MRTNAIRLVMLGTLLLPVSVQAQTAEPPAPDPAYDGYGDGQMAVLPDGRLIHLVCMGQGAPTVILTAGMGDWSATWIKVQRPVAEHTRVCAWDRAGFGLSDASAKAQTSMTTTADLEAALTSARIEGPYVMVGHSMGAYETLAFTDRRQAEVVGMVSVDGSVPNQMGLMRAAAPLVADGFDAYIASATAPLHKCIADLEAARVSFGDSDPDGCLRQPAAFPASLAENLGRRDSDPRRLATQASLTEQFVESGDQLVNPARNYGDMPLVVLTAGDETPPELPEPVLAQLPLWRAAWMRAHDQVAALSTRGVNRVVQDATHYIQTDRPDIVIATILEVVKTARSKETPTP